jgi:NhaP-type Na+/H+ or K+/H+ antiporter
VLRASCSHECAYRADQSHETRFKRCAFALRHLSNVIGEIFWGIGVGWLMLRLRRRVRDPCIEIALSILTPFLSYWVPEYLGGSGVLATVTTGPYISWNGFRLISAATRLQGIFFWDFFIYLIEGMVLLITGLQARQLIARTSDGHFRCGRERRGDRGRAFDLNFLPIH